MTGWFGGACSALTRTAAPLLLAMLVAAPSAVAQPAPFGGGSSSVTAADSARDAELDAMTATIASRLRCLVCRGQSVQESSAPLAREMQALIRTKLEEGETPEEIEAFFVASYGDFILLKPRARGLSALVYVLPAALFLTALLTVVFKLRSANRATVPADGAAVAGTTAASSSFESDLPAADREWLDAAVRGDR